MTPSEFTRTADAFREREEREWYRTAWMVAYLLRPHVDKKKAHSLTPEKLLGRAFRKRKPVDPQD